MQKMVTGSTLGSCPRADIFNLSQSSTHGYLVPFGMPLIFQEIIPTRLAEIVDDMRNFLQY